MKQVGYNRSRRGWIVVLALSLALNGFLLLLIVSDRPIEPLSVPIPEPTAPSPDAKTTVSVMLEETVEPPVFQWSDLVAEDLREYATNMEAMGCRADVVRAVLADEIRRRYVPLMRRLRRESVGDYWERSAGVKSSKWNERTPEERDAEEQLDEVYGQYRALHREFGIDEKRDRFPDFDGDDVRASFLSEEKRERLREQDEAVDQLRRKLRSERVPEEEIRKRVLDMEAAQDLERMEFLEPAEYEEYKLRTSSHAGLIGAGLIGNLFGFEPTPEERVVILHWRESAGDELTLEDWEQGVRPLLGDARFAEFQRAQDPSYRELTEMTAHFGLDEATANDVYASQRAAEAAAETLRTLDLDPDQQLEALAEVRAATEQTIRVQLGDTAFGVYARHADWLKALGAESVESVEP
jgi:hypothetical protein